MRLAIRFTLILALSSIVTLGLAWQFWRPGMAVYADLLADPAPPGYGGLSASWFGVSAVLLRDGEHAIFIDPFFSRPGGVLKLLSNPVLAPDEAGIRRWLERAGIERLDAVLVSHSHYDHAMDAGVLARLTGAVLIGSQSTLNIGRGAGLVEARLIPLDTLAQRRFGNFRVKFVASRHAGATGGRPLGSISTPLRSPARLSDYRQGGTYSVLIEHPQARILHHGSAGYIPGALAGEAADVVFLGVALIEDLPAYLEQTVRMTGAHTLIPVHWDDFTRPLDQTPTPMPLAVDLPRLFAGLQTQTDLHVRTMEVGVAVQLP